MSWSLYKGRYLPRPLNVPRLRALWSLLVGTWGILKSSWGVLVGLGASNWASRPMHPSHPRPLSVVMRHGFESFAGFLSLLRSPVDHVLTLGGDKADSTTT